MSLRTITAPEAKRLIEAGALLVDIREADEHARERIAQARLVPASSLSQAGCDSGEASQVIFHCRSGARTASYADRLARSVSCDAYQLEGGLEAWKKAGLPTIADRSQPLEMMRQVQLVAGGAVVLGVVLGTAVSPWLYGIAAFVGAGQMFAGATGFCGLAILLQRMPWNRRRAI